MPMRVCTGKMLSILRELTVKHGSMPLSFNLGKPGRKNIRHINMLYDCLNLCYMLMGAYTGQRGIGPSTTVWNNCLYSVKQF